MFATRSVRTHCTILLMQHQCTVVQRSIEHFHSFKHSFVKYCVKMLHTCEFYEWSDGICVPKHLNKYILNFTLQWVEQY